MFRVWVWHSVFSSLRRRVYVSEHQTESKLSRAWYVTGLRVCGLRIKELEGLGFN